MRVQGPFCYGHTFTVDAEYCPVCRVGWPSCPGCERSGQVKVNTVAGDFLADCPQCGGKGTIAPDWVTHRYT